jgi:hypothetical protein
MLSAGRGTEYHFVIASPRGIKEKNQAGSSFILPWSNGPERNTRKSDERKD